MLYETQNKRTTLTEQDVEEICRMYRGGELVMDIRKRFHISRERLNQILEERSVEREVPVKRGRPLKARNEGNLEYPKFPLDWCEDWDVARMILTGERKIPTRLRKRFCRGKIPGARILEWLEENQGYKWKMPATKKKG